MIVIVGLVILIAAAIAAVVGVLGNSGSGHALPHDFAVLGYHVTGSTGTLFLYGIVVGAAGLLGLRHSRQETAAVSQERDDLIGQRGTARAYTVGTPGNGTTGSDAAPQPGPADGRHSPGVPADAPARAASPANRSRP